MEEDMWKREAEGKEGEVYLLLLQRDLPKLKTSGPGDQGQRGSPLRAQTPWRTYLNPVGL